MVKKRGLSFFGAFYLKKLAANTPFLKSINFFGRLDTYDPSTSVVDNGETTGMFGIESAPTEALRVALNYRTTSFQDDTKDNSGSLYLNTVFEF